MFAVLYKYVLVSCLAPDQASKAGRTLAENNASTSANIYIKACDNCSFWKATLLHMTCVLCFSIFVMAPCDFNRNRIHVVILKSRKIG